MSKTISELPVATVLTSTDTYLGQNTSTGETFQVPYSAFIAALPAGPAGPTGSAGSTILNGTVDPSSGTGTDGDFYINTTTSMIFGPKASGTWPAGVSLVGPAGSTSMSDSVFEIYDNGDSTKKLKFEVSGITTATTRTVSIPDASTTLVGTDTTQTLTNKTLTTPVIASISNSGTITLPTGTRTLVARDTTDTLTNKTLTAPVIASIVNTGTLTLPTSTDTLVGRATTDTLTNKTLTSPVISTITNTGTLTLPTSTDTLVGRATTDTLTNKTISGSSNTITNVSLTTGVTGTLPVANGGTGGTDAATARSNLSAATKTQTDFISGFIPYLSNQDYKLVVNIPFGGTIVKTTTICTSGTATATWKVNTTALGGTNAISSTEVATTQSSSNTFVTGDDLVLTISSNSTCINMTFTIEFTRTLS